MAILRSVAFAVPVAAMMLPGPPAHACDSNYPWLCKPVPSIDSSETTETGRAAKPLSITSQRKDARALKAAKAAKPAAKSAKANARTHRSAQVKGKHIARTPPARRLVLRVRHQHVAAAPSEDLDPTPSESTKITPMRPSARGQQPAASSAGNPEPIREPNTGFAAAWERSTGLAAPVGAAAAASEALAPASEPGPAPAAPVASQEEVNEIDLAAADSAPQSDASWLRGLFIAFGGVLALGSALRLFL